MTSVVAHPGAQRWTERSNTPAVQARRYRSRPAQDDGRRVRAGSDGCPALRATSRWLGWPGGSDGGPAVCADSGGPRRRAGSLAPSLAARWSIVASLAAVDGRARMPVRGDDRIAASPARGGMSGVVAVAGVGRWNLDMHAGWWVGERHQGCLTCRVEDAWVMWCAPLVPLLWAACWVS